MIDARPQVVDLALYAGDTFTLEVDITAAPGWDPEAGKTWAAQVRAALTGDLVEAFTVAWVSGTLVCTLSATQTRALAARAAAPVAGAAYRWDLEVTDGAGVRLTVVRGAVSVTSDWTSS